MYIQGGLSMSNLLRHTWRDSFRAAAHALVVLIAVAFLNSGGARAATVTWNGGGGLNLSDPLNWGGTAPITGDDLVFPDGTFPRKSCSNDYPDNTVFNSITFAGKGYSISG